MNDPSCFHINQLIANIIGWLVVAFGWWIVHVQSVKRDQSNHKRKQQTDFLVDAFMKLANAANRPNQNDADHAKNTEHAIAVIQLFGSKEQVNLAKQFVDEIVANGSASSDPLLNSLRRDLRNELNLERIEGNVNWVRYQYHDKAKDPTPSESNLSP